MGRRTRVSIVHQRILSQAMLFSGRAPQQARLERRIYIRALRSALRMSQAQLSRRCGLDQAHVARLEAGELDIRLSTLRRIFDAMFCDLIVVPRPRKRPSDAFAERRLETSDHLPAWD
jgi:DNA-binding Xre family transcriptional regulator